MASPDFDLGQLNESQQLALQQYMSVTDQEIEAAIPLLARSEWNVQIAIAKFFDGESAVPGLTASNETSHIPPARQVRRHEVLMNGFDSSRSSSRRPSADIAPRIVPQPESQVTRTPPFIFALLFMPFNLLYKAITSSYRIFSYLFPFLPRLFPQSGTLHGRTATGRNTAGRRTLNPRDTATRFKREFEEEYGTGDFPFLESGYAQALDLAKKDLKFLLVVLCSVEHDDTQSFVKETLLAPEVSALVKDSHSNIIVWGGSVQDSEAYQVSNALNCTKFPFSALISLIPQSSTTAMQIIARIAGPVPPSTYVAKLQSAISEHSEALETLRSTRAAQNAERSLREEQNSAYERSLAVDRERARLKREAEAKKAREEKESREKEKAALELQDKVENWRSWRANNLLPEPDSNEKDIVRISLRMPSGERLVRKFSADTDMEELYAFVECKDVMEHQHAASTPKPTGYNHKYGFRLVSPMPRTVYEAHSTGTLKDQIGRSGNLIVEEIMDEEGDDE